ncbi:unnamed protein product [Allacma fusca]|uniref:Uncharacterized protein n=1 Tax=Allacma fusca TaxID=39272 RepID=A0A8J2K321_9HEXA|nr:unnamed protein product [Allacma fusca]
MHKILKQSMETPVGLVTIQTCEAGVHEIRIFESSKNLNPEEQPDLKDLDPSGVAYQTLTWLQNYFQPQPGQVDSFKDPAKYPPICWEGIEKTEFTEAVLKTLTEKVKHGDTVAYVDLAKLMGKPVEIHLVEGVQIIGAKLGRFELDLTPCVPGSMVELNIIGVETS